MNKETSKSQKLKLRVEKHGPNTLKFVILDNEKSNDVVVQPQSVLRIYEVIIGLRLKEYLKSKDLYLTIENRYDEKIRFFLSNNSFVYSTPINVFKDLYKKKVKELENLIMIDGNITALYKGERIILLANQKQLNIDLNDLKETLIGHLFFKKGLRIGKIFLDQKACMRLYAFLDMLM